VDPTGFSLSVAAEIARTGLEGNTSSLDHARDDMVEKVSAALALPMRQAIRFANLLLRSG
jgi:hypothetical protein